MVETYFHDEISCPNSATISKGLSRQKRSDHTYNKPPPGRWEVCKITIKVAVASHGHPGQKITSWLWDNVLEQSPRKSTRRLSQETDLSRSSVMRVMHQDFHLFPC